MPARARVIRTQVNRRGLEAVATSPEVSAALLALANVVKARAVALSPESTAESRDYFARRYGRNPSTPRYRDSFDTRVVRGPFNGLQRSIGIVENTAPHAAAVEFGNDRVRGRHILSRALDGRADD